MKLIDFKKLNELKGFHWFHKSTVAFWNSRIYSWNDSTGYFISSEKFNSDSKVKYTIRKGNFTTGQVDTVGKFQGYDLLSDAKKSLKQLVKG